MTKEELEKEARKYVKQNYCEMCVIADDCKSGCIDCFTVQAYIASAEPREKKITELEAKYYSVSEIAHHRGMCCISALKENRELEKENSALKDDIHTWKKASEDNSYKAFQLQEENKTLAQHILELQNDKGELTDRCKELEIQIEKMKCCYNCKHSRTEYEHCKTPKSEKWEIKEK